MTHRPLATAVKNRPKSQKPALYVIQQTPITEILKQKLCYIILYAIYNVF